MGQKVSPIGMRVGIIRDWQSRWYADDKEFGKLLIEDVNIRNFIEKYYAGLSAKAADRRKADPQSRQRHRGIFWYPSNVHPVNNIIQNVNQLGKRHRHGKPHNILDNTSLRKIVLLFLCV